MTYEQAINYIRKTLPEDELLNQLEEECAELIQSIAKLRRAKSGRNPTPVPVEKAAARVKDELADVVVCIDVCDIYNDPNFMEMQDTKIMRWVERLEAVRQ